MGVKKGSRPRLRRKVFSSQNISAGDVVLADKSASSTDAVLTGGAALVDGGKPSRGAPSRNKRSRSPLRRQVRSSQRVSAGDVVLADRSTTSAGDVVLAGGTLLADEDKEALADEEKEAWESLKYAYKHGHVAGDELQELWRGKDKAIAPKARTGRRLPFNKPWQVEMLRRRTKSLERMQLCVSASSQDKRKQQLLRINVTKEEARCKFAKDSAAEKYYNSTPWSHAKHGRIDSSWKGRDWDLHYSAKRLMRSNKSEAFLSVNGVPLVQKKNHVVESARDAFLDVAFVEDGCWPSTKSEIEWKDFTNKASQIGGFSYHHWEIECEGKRTFT